MKKLFLTMMMLFSASSVAYATDNDVQVWLTLNATNKVHNAVSLRFDNELRLKGDASEVGYIHSEVGLIFHPTRATWISVGVNGRFVLSPEKPKVLEAWTGGWQFRPSLDVTLNCPFLDALEILVVSNRTRVEFHVDSDGFSKWRGRNKTDISVRVLKSGDRDLVFAVSEEFFLVSDGVNENRLRVGFVGGVTRNSSLALYYQWQAQNTLAKDAEWTSAHGIGAAGILKF